MPPVALRAPGGPKRMVWDGQSRVRQPQYIPGVGMVPHLLMSGNKVPYSVCAIANTAWSTLAATAATRLWPLATLNDATGLWLTGGETDLIEGDSAATIISDITSYANNARAAGFGPIAATTIPGAGAAHFNGAAETQRIAYNSLLLAMAGGAVFEYVVDIEEGGTGPMVYFDGSPYYDGGQIHYTVAGAVEVARICESTNDAMLALL